MARRAKTRSSRMLNRWVAYSMPAFISALVGWATWVFVVLLCVNHLLLSEHRGAAAIALMAVYFVLLLLMASVYFRTVVAINFNPALVPKGPTLDENGEKALLRRRDDGDVETGYSNGIGLPPTGEPLRRPQPSAFDGPFEEEEEEDESAAERRAGMTMAEALHDGPGRESADVDAGSQTSLRGGSAGPGAEVSMMQALRDGPATEAPRDGNGIPAGDGTATITFPPQNPARTPSLSSRLQSRRNRRDTSSTLAPITQGHAYNSFSPARPPTAVAPGNLSVFTDKDAFVCEGDGLPRWCAICNCWKPDRAHHCSELGRCVYRMDHFCPWVGGVVAETSYKYFYQTVFYASVYCIFVMITLAVFTHERLAAHEHVNRNWIALIAVSALFGLFATGMTGSTSQMIARNVSTIDQLSWRTKVYQIAIRDPSPPPSSSTQDGRQHVWHDGKRFIIVKTQPGENPWRLQRNIDNFREVLGTRWWLWLLPIGRSPFRQRSRPEGLYKWNEPLMKRLRKEAGIAETADPR